MIDKGQCKICHQWLKLQANGKLSPHTKEVAYYIDRHDDVVMKRVRCRGVNPQPPKPEDYTTGWDHDPRDVSGGLPERDRRKF